MLEIFRMIISLINYYNHSNFVTCRCDDKSGSGSRTPEPGHQANREESLPSLLEASLTSSDNGQGETSSHDDVNTR